MSQSTKQQYIAGAIGAILILVIIGYGAYSTLLGVKVFTADDLASSGHVAYTAAGVNANATFSASKNLLTISAASDEWAKFKCTFEFRFSDWKDEGIRQLVLDPSNMEVLAGWDKIKVYLYDGTTYKYVGALTALKATTFQVVADDVDTLVSTEKVVMEIRAYNTTSDLVDKFDDVEQELGVDFTTGGTYDTVYALVAAGFINVIATFKRFIAGIAGSLGGVVMSAFTNNIIIIVVVAVGISAVLLYTVAKKKKGR